MFPVGSDNLYRSKLLHDQFAHFCVGCIMCLPCSLDVVLLARDFRGCVDWPDCPPADLES